jgi:hypothetical protein
VVGPRRRASPRGSSAGVPVTRLAARIDRTLDFVRWRRRTLGGHRSAPSRYAPGDDEAIRRCFEAGDDVVALAQSLGRSVDAVRLRARVLGAHRPAATRALAAAPKTRSCATATPREGRARASPRSCRDAPPPRLPRAAKLGLSDYARHWSADDEARLIRLVATARPLTEIARVLVRTPEAVRRRCGQLGISSTATTGCASRPAVERAGRRGAAPPRRREPRHLGPAAGPQRSRRRRPPAGARSARRARALPRTNPTPRPGRLAPGQRAAVGRAGAPLPC